MSLFQNDLFNQSKIFSFVDQKNQDLIQQLEIFNQIDSTNAYLLKKRVFKQHQVLICLAEEQTQGRGRFGRIWESPKNQNIYLSLLWRCASQPKYLPVLGLVTAVAMVQALKRYHSKILNDLSVKWPNDILYRHKKLAGILLETSNVEQQQIVIGIGLNTYLSQKTKERIDQPCIDLKSILRKKINRNRLVGFVIDESLSCLTEFEKNGLTPFLKIWYQLDEFLNQEVTIVPYSQNLYKVRGIVIGIDNTGALLVKNREGKLITINSGTIVK